MEEMWYLWSENTSEWNEDSAREKAHNILTMVEEFQTNRTKLGQWRASD